MQLKAGIIITVITMITIMLCKSEAIQPVRENPNPLSILLPEHLEVFAERWPTTVAKYSSSTLVKR